MDTYKRLRRSRWVWGGIVGLILFFIAYPNPVSFWRTVVRAINPPIDPAAVAHISGTLADDPARIEQWVKEHITYDGNDYEGWGVVFYVANPSEVLERGKGPCYGRAVVLASILADKGIAYRIYYVAGHIWVDYAGRHTQSAMENPQLAQFRWENGQWHFQGIGSVAMAAYATGAMTQLYWGFMPLPGKIALLILTMAVVALRWQTWRRFKRRAQ